MIFIIDNLRIDLKFIIYNLKLKLCLPRSSPQRIWV